MKCHNQLVFHIEDLSHLELIENDSNNCSALLNLSLCGSCILCCQFIVKREVARTSSSVWDCSPVTRQIMIATFAGVAAAITHLLANPDILTLDGLTGSVFAKFCRLSCGRHIPTAWETCNITEEYQRQVNLVTSLCAHTRGMDCYENIAELFEFIEFVETCHTDVEGQC